MARAASAGGHASVPAQRSRGADGEIITDDVANKDMAILGRNRAIQRWTWTEEQRKQMPARTSCCYSEPAHQERHEAERRYRLGPWPALGVAPSRLARRKKQRRRFGSPQAGGGLGLAVFISGGASREWNLSHTGVLLVAKEHNPASEEARPPCTAFSTSSAWSS